MTSDKWDSNDPWLLEHPTWILDPDQCGVLGCVVVSTLYLYRVVRLPQ